MKKYNYNSSLKKIVHTLKEKPLSNHEMLEYEPTKIHDYSEIENNLFHLDEILDNKNRCIIFYPTNKEKNMGHWTCCILNATTFEWFEPYGINPMKKMNEKLNSQLHLNPNYLIEKINNDGYEFQQNKIALQNIKDPKNNACGRFVLLRLALSNLKNEDFNNFLKKL